MLEKIGIWRPWPLNVIIMMVVTIIIIINKVLKLDVCGGNNWDLKAENNALQSREWELHSICQWRLRWWLFWRWRWQWNKYFDDGSEDDDDHNKLSIVMIKWGGSKRKCGIISPSDIIKEESRNHILITKAIAHFNLLIQSLQITSTKNYFL